MKAGKLTESMLKRSVLKQLHKRNEAITTKPAIGADFGMYEGSGLVALSTETCTLPITNLAQVAVAKAIANAACSGGKVDGVLVNLLLPTYYNEQQLRDLIQQIDAFCKKAGVDVLGGDTQVTRAVNRPVLSITAFGAAKKEHLCTVKNVTSDMDVLVTKWIGLEGTAILAEEKREELIGRFAEPFVDKARGFIDYLPVWSEAAVAAQSGASAIHDIAEGGIFGALWELGSAAGVGLEIDLKSIPIRQETVEICEFFDVNPYKLISGGSLVIVAKDGERLKSALEEAGFMATVIGRTTDSNDRVLISGEERRFLETTQTDEIHKIIL